MYCSKREVNAEQERVKEQVQSMGFDSVEIDSDDFHAFYFSALSSNEKKELEIKVTLTGFDVYWREKGREDWLFADQLLAS